MAQQKLNRTNQQPRFRPGLAADVNATATKNLAVVGEPYWTTDTNTLFVFDGSQSVPVAGRTLITEVSAATYDVLLEDHILHVTYTATGAVTSITLPTAQVTSGRMLVVKDAGGNALVNNITIDTEGGETIDGAATVVIALNYGVARLYCDGANWFVI